MVRMEENMDLSTHILHLPQVANARLAAAPTSWIACSSFPGFKVFLISFNLRYISNVLGILDILISVLGYDE